MTQPRCDACRFWEQRNIKDDYPDAGACRRSPPNQQVTPDKSGVYFTWPWTQRTDWCGEFQAKDAEPITMPRPRYYDGVPLDPDEHDTWEQYGALPFEDWSKLIANDPRLERFRK